MASDSILDSAEYDIAIPLPNHGFLLTEKNLVTSKLSYFYLWT